MKNPIKEFKSNWLDSKYPTINAFISLVLIVNIGLYIILQAGFEIQTTFAIKVLTCGLFIANLPIAGFFNPKKLITLFSGFLFFYILALLAHYNAINTFPIIAVMGLLLFLNNIQNVAIRLFRISNLIWLALASLFCIWFGLSLYATYNQVPLFYESAATPFIFRDNLFHLSIMQMMNSYHTISIGVDGLKILNYHIGSHHIVTLFASLLHVELPIAANSIIVTFFTPLYFICFINLIITFKEAISKTRLRLSIDTLEGRVFWLLFLILQVGILGSEVRFATLGNNSYILSISYVVAISLVFIGVCASIYAYFNKNDLYWQLFAIAVFFLASFFKISVAFVCLPAIAYFQIRNGYLMKKIFWASWILVSVLFVYFFFSITKKGGDYSFHLFDFFITYPKNHFEFISAFLYLISPVLVLSFVLYKTDIISINDLWKRAKVGELKLAETLIIALIISLLPGIFLRIGGGSAGYFSDIPRKICDSLLFTIFIQAAPIIKNVSFVTRKLAQLIVLALVVNMFFMIFIESKENFIKSLGFKSEIAGISLTGKSYNGLEAKFKEKNKNFKFIQTLRKINNLPMGIKQKSFVFIPQSDHYFYHEFYPNCPWLTSFLVPAVSGLALIDGMPAFDEIPMGNKDGMIRYGSYGFADYNFRKRTDKVLKESDLKNFDFIGKPPGDYFIFLLITASPSKIKVLHFY